jgi:hypothetical protein
MGTKRLMAPNSSHLIKPCSFHRPFTSSFVTTNLSSTSPPSKTTNHPLVTTLILKNHTPPINSPYQPPTLHVNVSQPYTFSNPLNHAQLWHFPPPILLAMIISPNLPPFLQHAVNLHLKSCPLHVGTNLSIEGWVVINIPVRDLIHPTKPFWSSWPNTFPYSHLTYINLTWVSTLDVFVSFHLSICHHRLYNHITIALRHDVQMAFRFPLEELA